MADRTVKGTLEWDVSDLLTGTDKGVKALRDTADEADRTERALADGFDEGVAAAGRLDQSIEQTVRGMSNLAGTDLGIDVGDGERDLARIADRVEDVADEAAVAGREIAEEVGGGMDRAARASGDLTETVDRDTTDQRRGWSRVRDEVGEYADELGGIGSLAGAGALGAVTVELGNQRASARRLQAQLGLTAEETQRVGDVAEDVFLNNFDDSLSEAGDTVRGVRTSLRELTDEELQAMAEGLIATEDAFGELGADVPILLEDVRTLTANFPGLAEADALDMIAASFQNGTGNAGDLADTLQEYPGDFARIGLEADDMFAILDAGFDAGIRNTDLVADGIREMAVRITEDGGEASDALAELFTPEEAERLRSDFAAGGEAGRDAFFDIMEGLAEVEDPLERNAAGVKIMGTRWEDTANQMPAFLDGLAEVEDGTYDATGATEKLNAQYDHTSSKIEAVKRQLTTGFVGTIGDVGGTAVEAATGVGTLALGAQGLGIDLRNLKSRIKGFSWSGLSGGAKVAGGITAIGIAVGVLAEAWDRANDRGLGDMAAILDASTELSQGARRGWIEATGDIDGMVQSLEDLGDYTLKGDLQAGLDALPFVDITTDMEQATAFIGEFDEAMGSLVAAGDIAAAGAAFDELRTAADEAGIPIDEQASELLPALSDQLDIAGLSTEDLTGELARQQRTQETSAARWQALADAQGEAASAAGGAAGATGEVTDELADAAEEVRSLDDLLGDLAAEYRELAGGKRDVRAATSDWEASLDSLTETVMKETGELDDNGEAIRRRNTSLDLSTEAGRDNEAAIRDSQIAAEDHALAVLEETGSLDAANAVLDQHRQDLHDSMIQAGFSEEAARDYSAEISEIPADAKTRLELEDAKARERRDAWVERLKSIPDFTETVAHFQGDYEATAAWMAELDDINRTVRTRGVFKSGPGPSALHGGTDWHPGGPAIINDIPGQIAGELVHLPMGAAVTPSEESVNMIAEGFRRSGIGGGGGPTYNVHGEPTQTTMARLRAHQIWAKS